MVASFVLTLLFIEAPRIAQLLEYRLLPVASFALDLAAFGLPLAALFVAGSYYQRASLRRVGPGAAIGLVEAGLLENRFDEIRRILQRNRDHLKAVSPRERSLLFDRRVVRATIQLRSFIHLEALADLDLFHAFENPLATVDGVMREIVAASDSPLRNAVIREYGGDEMATYPTEDRSVIARTLQSPQWYVASLAPSAVRTGLDERRGRSRIGEVARPNTGAWSSLGSPAPLAE